MKKIYALIFAGHLFVSNGLAQKSAELIPTTIHSSIGIIPKGSIHLAEYRQSDCIPADVMQDALAEAKNNISAFGIPSARRSGSHPLFVWPVQPKAGFSGYGFDAIPSFVDHNLTPGGFVQDYDCGIRSYDWANGNHQGVDIILWPYPWRRMDEEVMEIVAAAPGIIANKRDSYPDRSCVNAGNPNWNGVIIQHDDGSYAYYWHFKTGSATTKAIGDSVVAGEYLGKAGSSGSSNWPHLHFQVTDSIGIIIDPYMGACNLMNPDSWWLNQPPYLSPRINHLSTHSSMIEFYSCPTPEITYEKDTFYLGDSLVLRTYFRDLETNAAVQYDLIDPNGTSVINWTFNSPWALAPLTYAQWYYVIDQFFQDGNWKLQAIFDGQTYEKDFFISSINPGVEEQIANVFSASVHYMPTEKVAWVDIGTSASAGVQVEVFSLTGKLVQSLGREIPKGVTRMEFNTDAYRAGSYLVKVNSEGRSVTKKLVIF